MTKRLPASERDRGESAGQSWPAWHAALVRYRDPSAWQACWQLANTVVPYVALWRLMIVSLRRGYPPLFFVTLATLAAAFLVRIFILFHDCVHGSLFPGRGANAAVGA